MRPTPLALVLCCTAISGCCSMDRARFWRVKDLTGGKTYYTADTEEYPLGLVGGPVFVSTDGKLVGLASYELEGIDYITWQAESGASVDVRFMWGSTGGQKAGCRAFVLAAPR